ncbi:amelogenin, X isoform-like [Diachasmimorpha longicaudata]|uniref:amelogenin, X isoform-like n=1 Tax=Diachasmimorpha longicaudata TaxID=58733 RepID=UPI0030B87238
MADEQFSEQQDTRLITSGFLTFYVVMAQSMIIGSLLVRVLAYVGAQTVYIDLDTGKIVGITQGKSGQGNYGNPQPGYQGRAVPQQPQPNYQPIQQYPQGRPHVPQQPYYPFGHQHTQAPYQSQPNNLKTEWVCTDPKTGSTMIIASEPGPQGPVIPNPRNPYQDNPWLQNTRPGQDMPGELPNPTPVPNTPPPPTTPAQPAPFPKLDNIDWTQFLDKTTKKPLTEASGAATDGEGIIEPRGGN